MPEKTPTPAPKSPSAPEIPELMYIHAAATRLQVSRRYIYTLIQAGTLEAYRLGEKRGLRVTKRSVTAMLTNNRVDPDDYCK